MKQHILIQLLLLVNVCVLGKDNYVWLKTEEAKVKEQAKIDDNMQASVEKAMDKADARLDVCPTALAIPTQGPLDSFNARTYPACYVEWWFGDGAPALERDRPMLFEQVARRLLNIEEHEYHLNSDLTRYRASSTHRTRCT